MFSAAHQVLTVKIQQYLMALAGLGIEEKSLQNALRVL